MVEDGRVMLPVVAASEVGSTSEIRLVAFPWFSLDFIESDCLVSFAADISWNVYLLWRHCYYLYCCRGFSSYTVMYIFVSSPGFQKQTCKRDVVAQGFTSVGSNLYIDAEWHTYSYVYSYRMYVFIYIIYVFIIYFFFNIQTLYKYRSLPSIVHIYRGLPIVLKKKRPIRVSKMAHVLVLILVYCICYVENLVLHCYWGGSTWRYMQYNL